MRFVRVRWLPGAGSARILTGVCMHCVSCGCYIVPVRDARGNFHTVPVSFSDAESAACVGYTDGRAGATGVPVSSGCRVCAACVRRAIEIRDAVRAPIFNVLTK